MERERGSASVEHAALVLLAALVACAVVALVLAGPERRDGTLASALAFKQRCAVRYPDPCWQDPLTEAYGRAAKLAPDLGDDLYFKLGNIAFRQRDIATAREHWKRVLQLNPGHQLAKTNLESLDTSGVG